MSSIFVVSGEDYVLDYGVVNAPVTESFPPHFHEAWEILFFLHGDVEYRVGGRTYKLRRGDLVLSMPTVLHRIEPSPKERYERFNIIFDGAMFPKRIMDLLARGIDVYSFGQGGRVMDTFERIKEYTRHFEGEELSLLVKNLITELVFNIAISDGYASGQTVTNSLIAEALRYIDEHLTEISGIDEMCEHLYITKSHLHHLFTAHLGVTPKRYINSKRLLLAQRMIRQGKRATAVASEVGYADYATFFRGYKKYFGYPPSEEVTRVSLDAIVG